MNIQVTETLLDSQLPHVLSNWFNSIQKIVTHHSTYMVAKNIFLQDNKEYMNFIENLSIDTIVSTDCVSITLIQLNKYLVNSALLSLCSSYNSGDCTLTVNELFLVTLTVTIQILGNTQETEKLRFIRSCMLKAEPVIRNLKN